MLHLQIKYALGIILRETNHDLLYVLKETAINMYNMKATVLYWRLRFTY